MSKEIKLSGPIKYELKKKIEIKRREPSIMFTNHYLMNKIIDSYLDLKTVLKLMETNFNTYHALRGNSQFWYKLWRGKKWSKPSGHKYYHKGPLKYSCFRDNYAFRNSSNLINAVQKIRNNVDEPISDVDMKAISRFRREVIDLREEGYTTMRMGNYSASYWYYNCCPYNLTEFSEESERNHWICKPTYPLKYYKRMYDRNEDYYEKLLGIETLSKLKPKLESCKRRLRKAEGELSWARSVLEGAERRVKEAREEVSKYERALEMYYEHH